MTQWLIEIGEWVFLLYFIGLNCGYLTLNFLSLISLSKLMRVRMIGKLPQIYSGLTPPISLLVPAYNEQASIASSIHSMLQLSYQEFEIVVINDGSKDDTFKVLEQEFALIPFPEAYRQQLKTQPVRRIYRSTLYNNLRVIDKESGGKADSLNAGINAARYPLFCGVDADSILQRDSLQRVVQPFLEDTRVVAAGGSIRIANGCQVSNGFLQKVDLPNKILPLLQIVEYMRAFLFGRMGWSPHQHDRRRHGAGCAHPQTLSSRKKTVSHRVCARSGLLDGSAGRLGHLEESAYSLATRLIGKPLSEFGVALPLPRRGGRLAGIPVHAAI